MAGIAIILPNEKMIEAAQEAASHFSLKLVNITTANRFNLVQEAVSYTHLDVYKRQGETVVHALKNADFSVPKGEFVAIVGESGSGKSTLLNMIGALDTPTSGKVFIDGKDIFSMKEHSLIIFCSTVNSGIKLKL